MGNDVPLRQTAPRPTSTALAIGGDALEKQNNITAVRILEDGNHLALNCSATRPPLHRQALRQRQIARHLAPMRNRSSVDQMRRCVDVDLQALRLKELARQKALVDLFALVRRYGSTGGSFLQCGFPSARGRRVIVERQVEALRCSAMSALISRSAADTTAPCSQPSPALVGTLRCKLWLARRLGGFCRFQLQQGFFQVQGSAVGAGASILKEKYSQATRATLRNILASTTIVDHGRDRAGFRCLKASEVFPDSPCRSPVCRKADSAPGSAECRRQVA